MADRKAQLQKLLEKEPNDPFLLYGLALEHKKAGEAEQAMGLLERVIQVDAAYCYAYFQLGQVYSDRGDLVSARAILERGVAAAREAGDSHAESEIAGALGELEA